MRVSAKAVHATAGADDDADAGEQSGVTELNQRPEAPEHLAVRNRIGHCPAVSQLFKPALQLVSSSGINPPDLRVLLVYALTEFLP